MSEKVLLILVDGLRPDSIQESGCGEMLDYFRQGSYSMKAMTVIPPVTLPVHISLFHSVDPDRHQTMGNEFVKMNHPVEGLIEKLAAAGKRTAMFYTWGQLRDICAPNAHLAYSWFKDQHWVMRDHGDEGLFDLEMEETKAAVSQMKDCAPDFVFLYLGGTDEFGHHHGWMSEQYFNEVRHVWNCIKYVKDNLPQEYSVIITADHGGHLRQHGDNIPEEMMIPISFIGNRFKENNEIFDVNIKDIAPTILELFGIEADYQWEGKSIIGIS